MVEMDQDPQTYKMQQENFKKKLCKYGKSRFLIARLHFSMVVLWGQLHRDFLRFANWTSSSGRRGNFYHVPQVQHPLLCALSTAEALSCPKSIGSIGSIVEIPYVPQSRHRLYLEKFCRKLTFCWWLWQLMPRQGHFCSFKHRAHVEPCEILISLAASSTSEI